MALEWLSKYKQPKDTKVFPFSRIWQKIFRNNPKDIPKESESAINKLSKQANQKRAETLQTIKKAASTDFKFETILEELEDLDYSTILVNNAYDVYL